MARRKGRDYIFWLDLECTGSGDDEDVLELGAVITNRDLEELDSRSIVFPALPEKLQGMSDVVVRMHTVNGLLDEVNKLGPHQNEFAKQMFDTQVSEELAAWVRSFAGGDHMPFAGSGVSHYDRKYIKRDFKALNDRLTHWALDVGVLRRSLDLAGIQAPDLHLGKTHRAVDDARTHIEEMRKFLNWCRGAVELGMDSVL